MRLTAGEPRSHRSGNGQLNTRRARRADGSSAGRAGSGGKRAVRGRTPARLTTRPRGGGEAGPGRPGPRAPAWPARGSRRSTPPARSPGSSPSRRASGRRPKRKAVRGCGPRRPVSLGLSAAGISRRSLPALGGSSPGSVVAHDHHALHCGKQGTSDAVRKMVTLMYLTR